MEKPKETFIEGSQKDTLDDNNHKEHRLGSAIPDVETSSPQKKNKDTRDNGRLTDPPKKIVLIRNSWRALLFLLTIGISTSLGWIIKDYLDAAEIESQILQINVFGGSTGYTGSFTYLNLFGISEFLVDDSLERALGAQLGEQLSSRARPEFMKALDLVLEAKIGDGIGRGGDLGDRGHDSTALRTLRCDRRRPRRTCRMLRV